MAQLNFKITPYRTTAPLLKEQSRHLIYVWSFQCRLISKSVTFLVFLLLLDRKALTQDNEPAIWLRQVKPGQRDVNGRNK